MLKRAVSNVMLVLLVTCTLIVGSSIRRAGAGVTDGAPAYAEQWVPTFPYEVALAYRMENWVPCVDVSAKFPVSGQNVSDWGTLNGSSNVIRVNAEIWQWTGMVLQVVTIINHTYDLGYLESGEYLFIFEVWGQPMAIIGFSVEKRPSIIVGDINCDFEVNLQDLVLLAHAHGSKPSDPNWNPNADIDGNGVVGLSDLVILALHYGQHNVNP